MRRSREMLEQLIGQCTGSEHSPQSAQLDYDSRGLIVVSGSNAGFPVGFSMVNWMKCLSKIEE